MPPFIVVWKMIEPYQPPLSPINVYAGDEKLALRRKFWLRTIWISVTAVIIPPMFGLARTVIGMVGAFGELSKTGEADPEALAGDISVSLLTTAWGLVISFLALIVLIGATIRFFTLPKLTGPPSQESRAPRSAP